METTQMSIKSRMNKLWHAYTIENYTAMKMNTQKWKNERVNTEWVKVSSIHINNKEVISEIYK